MNQPVYFISDLHIGLGKPEDNKLKLQLLELLIEKIVSEKASLYILGDIFDFWMEYKHVIPRGYEKVLYLFETLRRQGVTVDYLLGNHDIWAEDLFLKEFGFKIHRSAYPLEIEGKKIYLSHGDETCRMDVGYMVLKKILRNRLLIRLFKYVHPDAGIPLALFASRKSRERELKPEWFFEKYYEIIIKQKFREGFCGAVTGHIHYPNLITAENRFYMNLGDWITFFTFGKFAEKKFMLLKWQDREIVTLNQVTLDMVGE